MNNRTKAGIGITLAASAVGLITYLQVQKDAEPQKPQPIVSVPIQKSSPTPESTPEETAEAIETQTPRGKRGQRVTADAEPTPAPYPTPIREGLYPRAYAGDVIGPMRFTVPVGAYVTLQNDAGNFAAHHWTVASPLQCDEKISIYPCQMDWAQPDGTIMRGHFAKCLKLDPDGTVDEHGQKYVYEDSCEWQRMNDARP